MARPSHAGYCAGSEHEGPSVKATPLVSVVMPFFNGASFLHESIASVASQSYDRWELLLVDDGSTDGSANVARSWVADRPARMRYLQHADAANRGISASRNLGIRHASGELVAFLDADDVWLKDKLARHVELLAARPEAGMMYGRTEYCTAGPGNLRTKAATTSHGWARRRIRFSRLPRS